jgi:hypothetical protein
MLVIRFRISSSAFRPVWIISQGSDCLIVDPLFIGTDHDLRAVSLGCRQLAASRRLPARSVAQPPSPLFGLVRIVDLVL